MEEIFSKLSEFGVTQIKNFLSLGARVLWKRLAPDLLSAEQLHDVIKAGFDDLEEEEIQKTCDLWLEYYRNS